MINLCRIWCFAFLIIHGAGVITFAQDKQDTVSHRDFIKKERSDNVFKRLLGLITREPKADQPRFAIKSEEPFLKYEGKIIRRSL